VTRRWAHVVAAAAVALVATACSGEEPAATTTTLARAEDAVVPPAVDAPSPQLSSEQLGGLRFTDVTAAAGLQRDRSTRDLLGEDGMTGPVSVVDIDGDGRSDLFLPRTGDFNSLYRNNGDGTFTDIGPESGLQGMNPEFGTGPTVFFDADADGDQDAYLAAVGAESDRLYRNDGTGRFTDVTQESGVFQPPPTRLRNGDQVHGLDVGDVNGDGALDLIVVQWDTAVTENAANAGAQREASSGDGRLDRFGNICASSDDIRAKGIPRVPGDVPNRSRLWINNGDGTFRDGTSEWGVGFDQILGFTPVFADVNDDGRPDLTITGDACTSHLYLNVDGRRFEDVTRSSGVGTDENGMGSVVRDVTGDGAPDWFITSISYPTADQTCPVVSSVTGCSGNRLYVNDGRGRFTDETDRYGLRQSGWGWGAAVEDFANDGTPDVVANNGYGEADARRPEGKNFVRDYFRYFLTDPLRFWIRTGDGFSEAAGQVGLNDTAVGTGLAPIDYDADGDLDLIVIHSEGAPTLYRNDVSGRRWLQVRLDDPTSPGNRSGIGARVVVTPKAGATKVVVPIATGGSYESQKEPVAHVGLGAATTAATVEVYWPGETSPQRLQDVPADQVLTVRRG
jgi:hypothetical protein